MAKTSSNFRDDRSSLCGPSAIAANQLHCKLQLHRIQRLVSGIEQAWFSYSVVKTHSARQGEILLMAKKDLNAKAPGSERGKTSAQPRLHQSAPAIQEYGTVSHM